MLNSYFKIKKLKMKKIYYYSTGVHIVRDGVVQEWLPCLNKKDHINKDFMPEVEKYFFLED